MGSLKKNNKWGWVVLLLIVINIVSLSALWIGYSKEPGRGSEGERSGGKFLEEHLQLTTAQTRELKDIRDDHFQKMRSLRKELQDTRSRFHSLHGTEGNTIQVEDLAAKIGSIHATMEKGIYNHFSEIRGICTDEQKEIFDKVILDVMQRGDKRNGPQGPPPGRPSGRGGQGRPPNGR